MSKGSSIAERADVLSRLALFENCSRKELEQVAKITVEAERPAGTLLTREGKDGGLMFVLLEGEADVVASTPEGEKVIGQVCAGDVVGELSLIDGQARSASVKATTPVKVLEVASDDFTDLVQDSPHFVRNLLRSLSLRVREADALTT